MGSGWPFGPDDLACVLGATGRATPTPLELAGVLTELYPAGTGPTVAGLLAGGWLVPTIDKQRLRLPPFLPAEMHQRYALPAMPPPIVTQTRDAVGSRAEPQNIVRELQAFSYFNGPITNTTPRAAITVADLYQVIVAPPSSLRNRAAAAREEYKAHGKSTRYRESKNRLDYITVGGTFARREDTALVKASNLLVLDFDEMKGDVADARAALLADEALAPAIALLFVSPSGDGLKVVMAADMRYSRGENYRLLADYLTDHYGWGPTLDSRTADLSRACFLSHDPDAWLAPA